MLKRKKKGMIKMIAAVVGIILTCAVIMLGVGLKTGVLMLDAEEKKAVITKVQRDTENMSVWKYELEVKGKGRTYTVETHKCITTKEYHVGDEISVKFKTFASLPNIQVDEEGVIEENNANTIIVAGSVLLIIELVVFVAGMLN